MRVASASMLDKMCVPYRDLYCLPMFLKQSGNETVLPYPRLGNSMRSRPYSFRDTLPVPRALVCVIYSTSMGDRRAVFLVAQKRELISRLV